MDKMAVISLLRQQEYVSGQWISQQFGLTRAAVWKVIEELRTEGYPIESAHRLGYRLTPPDDGLWPSLIRRHMLTAWAGMRMDYYDTIDSTNRVAHELGELSADAAPHGTLVIADEQTSGRGRMTRSWQSQPGDGALMSLLLRPTALHPIEATGIVLVTALAVNDACRHFGAETYIKWPNDIVYQGRKLCGMLLDMQADMDTVRYAVAGVGLNIAGCPRSDALPHVTCLNEAAGQKIPRAEAVAQFLACFESAYDAWAEGGIPAISEKYCESCITIGRRVRVIGTKEQFEATATGIDGGGALMVRMDSGESRAVHAGDVSVRGIMGYV